MSENRGTARRIWLLLASEGGRWSVSEIEEALQIDTYSLSRACNAMAEHGTLTKYERTGNGTGSRVQFGVTSACKPVNGVTLADLAECGVIRLEASA